MEGQDSVSFEGNGLYVPHTQKIMNKNGKNLAL